LTAEKLNLSYVLLTLRFRPLWPFLRLLRCWAFLRLVLSMSRLAMLLEFPVSLKGFVAYIT